ncbi:MAG: MOSC domain-containing protein [Rhodospirillales bacterium]|nr:MOSC domain-containing protein [Rhodospirillales bacterium]
MTASPTHAAPSAADSAARVVSVQVGRIAPLGPEGVPSGFVKRPVDRPVAVTDLGLAGDEQADLRVHGGSEKAVYGYAHAAYAEWRETFPEHGAMLVPGAFGENLTIDGTDEEQVCIGDIVRVGTATLQIAQPRQPCFKLALRFADRRMPRAMIRNGRSGWYYRVLATGVVAAGDGHAVLARPNPHWSMARFNRLLAAKAWPTSDLAELIHLPGLASGWRDIARSTLADASRNT